MSGEFVDSNILLYLTASDPLRRATVKRLLRCGLIASVQVLNESVNVLRKPKYDRSWPDVISFLGDVAPLLDVRNLTHDTHRNGLVIAQRYKTSWWDSLIIAAAIEAGCTILYSEDMHAGLIIDGRLTIVNPFA